MFFFGKTKIRPIFAHQNQRITFIDFIWPIRLVVRTPGFHPGNRSSILLWAAELVTTNLAHSSSG